MIHNKKYETKVLEEYFRSENFKYFKVIYSQKLFTRLKYQTELKKK